MISATGGLPPLIIRADASSRMGIGHVMRCLALGQAWQDRGGEVVFIMAQSPPALESRLKLEGMEVIGLSALPGSVADARQTTAWARERQARWLVVDGYQFEADYQRQIKESQISLLVIDDYGHAGQYWADLVLNQNVYAHEGLYPRREAYCRLLLGMPYVLLRREFRQWQGWRRDIPEVARKILITLGGGDSDNVSGKVVSAFGHLDRDELEAVVLAGGANQHLEELKGQVAGMSGAIRLATDVNNMPELMAWADVAVTAGGSTCWEAAFMGLPCLVIVLADNQVPTAAGLAERGAARTLGRHQELATEQLVRELSELLGSKGKREELCWQGQALVNGHGTDRIMGELLGG